MLQPDTAAREHWHDQWHEMLTPDDPGSYLDVEYRLHMRKSRCYEATDIPDSLTAAVQRSKHIRHLRRAILVAL